MATLIKPGTGKYEQLLERCRGLAPIPTAVAYPCEETALAGSEENARGHLVVTAPTGGSAGVMVVLC